MSFRQNNLCIPEIQGSLTILFKEPRLLPPHRVYVEPFAGDGAVLFVKAPAEKTVVNSAEPQIAEVHRIIKQLDAPHLDRLGRFSWVGDKRIFNNLKRSEFSDELGTLYRHLYLSEFQKSGAAEPSFNKANQGRRSRIVKRLQALLPTLPNLEVHAEDYEDVVRKYDGPETVLSTRR